ncbi:hypothetical protein CANINC_004867 [Pichia inconspicua]|uniref:FF domain-containing protein n=1 Tax=Pichia inconspicua TaxID=52247 RepID=A0A4V4NF58_9ASCO|nr:hypothetical protein CANINC_004867 [[Candida] inconspicua]
MSEPPNKKIKLDKEETKQNEVDDEQVVDEVDDFGLNSSDLEDLLAESDDDSDNDADNAKDIDDPEIKEYVEKYPKLTKQEDLKTCVEFIRLLENAKIDQYSCYDLDVGLILTDPNYIIKSCNNLDETVQRELWDEYCKNATSVEDVDSPEIQFVKFLKDFVNDNKIPKFYTDFNRITLRKEKGKCDSVYSDLCKVLSREKRQEIFNVVKEFLQIERSKRAEFCLNLLNGFDDVRFDDILKSIGDGKIVSCYVFFLLDEEELRLVVEKMNNT